MRRKWSLIAVGVLVLCVVGMVPVLAQGPGGNPIYATIEYVDQMVADVYEYIDQKVAELYAYVDAQMGGGDSAALPPWQIADGYEWTFYQSPPWEPAIYYLQKVGQGCSFGDLVTCVANAHSRLPISRTRN